VSRDRSHTEASVIRPVTHPEAPCDEDTDPCLSGADPNRCGFLEPSEVEDRKAQPGGIRIDGTWNFTSISQHGAIATAYAYR